MRDNSDISAESIIQLTDSSCRILIIMKRGNLVTQYSILLSLLPDSLSENSETGSEKLAMNIDLHQFRPRPIGGTVESIRDG